MLHATTRKISSGPKPSGLVWIDCPHSLVAAGLERVLEEEAWVHVGSEPPEDIPSSVIYYTDDEEGLLKGLRRIQGLSPGIPILVFGLHMDLPLALAALQYGARGFIHSKMEPDQIVRAIKVVTRGEMVAPRKLLEYLITRGESVGTDSLSARQKEVLGLLAEGLSNAKIAKRLYLSESTVKQHLRAAYKLLRVNNRTEAAKLVRDGY